MLGRLRRRSARRDAEYLQSSIDRQLRAVYLQNTHGIARGCGRAMDGVRWSLLPILEPCKRVVRVEVADENARQGCWEHFLIPIHLVSQHICFQRTVSTLLSKRKRFLMPTILQGDFPMLLLCFSATHHSTTTPSSSARGN